MLLEDPDKSDALNRKSVKVGAAIPHALRGESLRRFHPNLPRLTT